MNNNFKEGLEAIKRDMKANPPIDPNKAVLAEKVKGKSPALAKLFMDLENGRPSNDNLIVKINEKVNNLEETNHTYPNQRQPNNEGVRYNPNAEIQYNEYVEDENDMLMEQRIKEAYAKKGFDVTNTKQVPDPSLIFEKKQQTNPTEYFKPTYQPKSTVTNDPMKDALLELFSRDIVLRVVKEYMKDEEFKKEIIGIVKTAFKKK